MKIGLQQILWFLCESEGLGASTKGELCAVGSMLEYKWSSLASTMCGHAYVVAFSSGLSQVVPSYSNYELVEQ